ncbi:nuclear transport factor 2 family protein [Mycolicibacterium goodii]|uniref:nuclear transport factor 2 family protein n=1 Tax=Mycolicibacterium goodii TaxID=134601 RepID=UPI000C269F8C|nr:nuclear transport factor 2 family protein [Mycolicibacterium goodii]PJK23048.1 hypothetical protein CSX11_07470 [Mycolicibacterium goodii]
MNTNHVDEYFKALSGRDKVGIVPHLSEDIVLTGPIYPEPTAGKEAVVKILSGFIETIETLEVNLTISSGRDVAVFFTFTSDGTTIKGNEHLHLDENGLIDSIEVAWQPLTSAVLIQEIFAKKMGLQPLRLVPA